MGHNHLKLSMSSRTVARSDIQGLFFSFFCSIFSSSCSGSSMGGVVSSFAWLTFSIIYSNPRFECRRPASRRQCRRRSRQATKRTLLEEFLLILNFSRQVCYLCSQIYIFCYKMVSVILRSWAHYSAVSYFSVHSIKFISHSHVHGNEIFLFPLSWFDRIRRLQCFRIRRRLLQHPRLDRF